MATSEEIQQLREMIALQTAQIDAMTRELTAQRAETAQADMRSGVSSCRNQTHVLWRARWQRTLVDVVVQDVSLLCGNGTEAG